MATTLTKANFAGSGVSAMVPSFWSDMMQVPLRKGLVAEAVANNQFRAKLTKGDTIHFPYIAETAASAHTAGGTFAPQDISSTDENLVVDTAYLVANYIEDFEELQANYSYMLDLADNAGYKLRDVIDTAVLLETTAAASGLFYESTGVPIAHAATNLASGAITATTANIINVFANARLALRKQNVEEAGDWCVVTSPEVAMLIELVGTEKGFSVADATLRNGYAGGFLGFQVYISNNLPDGYNYFGRKGMIHSVIQASPNVQIKDVANKLGKNLVSSILFGVKAFLRSKSRYLVVKITT